MKIVLLGDVGGPDAYHAGDEAMLDAAIDQLRQRGDVEVTVVSADPADTAERYGVQAVAPIGFAPGQGTPAATQRDRRLAAVLEGGAAARYDDEPETVRLGQAQPALAAGQSFLDAVDGAEAVLVTGGGNLCSSWPEHVYERVAALNLARRNGLPAAVTSQSVGPDLTDREAALLADALSTSRLVGLRERSSMELASALLAPSTPRRSQLDDAFGLPGDAVPAFDGDGALQDGFVALTVNPLGTGPDAEARLDQLAAFVRRVYQRAERPVLFLPHVGRWHGEPAGDVAVGEALRRRLGDGPELVVAPLLPARQLATLTRQAAAIVSTRYHPIVFGMSGAVPCLAVYQDRYTATKLAGALAHAGLGDWRVPLEALATDAAGDVFDELWDRRDELADHLDAVIEPWTDRQRHHWDEVWQALAEPGSAVAVSAPDLVSLPEPAALPPKLPGTAALNLVASEHLRQRAELETRWRDGFLDAERYALDLRTTLTGTQQELEQIRHGATAMIDDLRAQVGELDLRRAQVEAENILLLDEAFRAERSAAAARALAAELHQELDTVQAEVAGAQQAAANASAVAVAQRAELDAVYATKTMRWTRGARRVYRGLRRPDRHRPEQA